MEETKPRTSKQVIVMRKLNCRKGKMVSQGSHSAVKTILDLMRDGIEGDHRTKTLVIENGSALEDWIFGRFTKITVVADSLEELMEIYKKAESVGIPCSLITDAGLTEFHGVPTVTACCLGPAWSDEVDSITGHLKLL